MPELILHFEATEGADLAAAAAALQTELSKVPGVESADTRAQKFRAIGPAEIISTLQVATDILQHTAAFLGAAAAVYTAWENVKEKFPWLKAPKSEVGLEQVPVKNLADEHRIELASD
jgi:hypothetical protein